jgi:hypothetical protein
MPQIAASGASNHPFLTATSKAITANSYPNGLSANPQSKAKTGATLSPYAMPVAPNSALKKRLIAK